MNVNLGAPAVGALEPAKFGVSPKLKKRDLMSPVSLSMTALTDASTTASPMAGTLGTVVSEASQVWNWDLREEDEGELAILEGEEEEEQLHLNLLDDRTPDLRKGTPKEFDSPGTNWNRWVSSLEEDVMHSGVLHFKDGKDMVERFAVLFSDRLDSWIKVPSKWKLEPDYRLELRFLTNVQLIGTGLVVTYKSRRFGIHVGSPDEAQLWAVLLRAQAATWPQGRRRQLNRSGKCSQPCSPMQGTPRDPWVGLHNGSLSDDRRANALIGSGPWSARGGNRRLGPGQLIGSH